MHTASLFRPPKPKHCVTTNYYHDIKPPYLGLLNLHTASSLMDYHDIYARALPRGGAAGGFLYRSVLPFSVCRMVQSRLSRVTLAA